MKYLLLALSLSLVLIVSCTKENPYSTDLTTRLVGSYVGTLDSLDGITDITRASNTTLKFDLKYQASAHQVHFDSVAMLTPSTFQLYGNSVYEGSGKFQGNIVIYTIRAIADTTEIHKFYGNK